MPFIKSDPVFEQKKSVFFFFLKTRYLKIEHTCRHIMEMSYKVNKCG